MKQKVLEVVRTYRRRVMLMGLLLLVNVCLMVVVTAFQEPELDRRRDERRTLLSARSVEGREGASAAYESDTRDLGKLRALLPAKRDFPAFLEGLMESASSCGVTMGPVAYTPTAVKDRKLLNYELTLTVTGRYGAVKAFLFDLQLLDGLSVIDHITLKSGDPYAEQVTMDARLTVFFKDNP